MCMPIIHHSSHIPCAVSSVNNMRTKFGYFQLPISALSSIILFSKSISQNPTDFSTKLTIEKAYRFCLILIIDVADQQAPDAEL